jgi:DNA-3-methyladenine glycosylase I
MKRCDWPGTDELMINYHDTEWGVPVHDDPTLFEYLVLDCFQAGLSWRTILHKRHNFEKAFANFNARKVALFKTVDIKRLLQDAGIVRNRLKIEGTVRNARAFIAVQKEYCSFDKYIWQFTGGRMIINKWKTIKQIPVSSLESDAMSRDLKQRGFSFVGTTICYAFMQAAGMVNDHTLDCFRYHEVNHEK